MGCTLTFSNAYQDTCHNTFIYQCKISTSENFRKRQKSARSDKLYLKTKHILIGHLRVTNTLFQNEATCKTFLAKMHLTYMGIKNSFHINDFALRLALKARLWPTRGACKPNLQVAITHAQHVCSKH